MRAALGRIIENPWFERVIIALIVINAITLGLETDKRVVESFGGVLKFLDRAILAIFVIEIIMRLIYRGWSFFRDPWRLFDLAVVGVALFPATGNFSVLRALRILRVLRLVSAVPAMRRVVTGLVNAIPGMGSVVLLLGLIFYVFAVIATKLFGADFPDWFGSIGESAYSLFQIMTLESWSMGIVRPVMEVFPYAWAFFVPFIILTSFAVLNLFIGIIVDAMQRENEAEAHEERSQVLSEQELILSEIREVRKEMAAISARLDDGKRQ